MTKNHNVDVEKYKDHLLEFHIRKKAREESTGWRDTLSLFMLFPIMIGSLWFFAPIADRIRIEDAEGWMLIVACLVYSILVMFIWLPFFAWGVRHQTAKAKEIYDSLRSEYGLEPKDY